jgi:hypothetical protein
METDGHRRVRKSPPLVATMMKMNPVYILF